ncbi:MAG: SDR family NAD(P)-dependent oxidoreductase [Deltaproteobacteria bacterium]|nr:SDR family NAD(P)-dependent oxidoreductase [Deltaproteobacteria bacterium]
MTVYAKKTVLITGANSGLGKEAAAQLAEAGFGRIILACRTVDKGEKAQQELAARTGKNPFEVVAVDVSSIAATEAAAAEIIRRSGKIDALLLNAGMVSGETRKKSEDGFELSFASSMIGHHLLSMRLLDAGLLAKKARVILVGSEAANADLPAMMDMKLYDFATGIPRTFGNDLHDAMENFIRGSKPDVFSGTHYYTTTKLFSAWWSASMNRKFGDRISVFTVSPGSNMGTNAGRNVTGFKKFLFTVVMPAIGGAMGMNMPTAKGAKRYVDVLLDEKHEFKSGKTYTSAPKKLVGPLHEVTYAHLLDEVRQEAAWNVLTKLTGSEKLKKRVS